MGLNDYAHATWLTSPNQDLASVIFWGVGKLNIAFSRLSQGVTPEDVIWRFLYSVDNSIFLTSSQECD